MNNRILSTAIAAMTGLCTVPLTLGQSLEDVEKKIADAMAKHKTVQYESKFTQDTKTQDFEMTASGTSTVAYKKTGENGYLSRTEFKQKSKTKAKGQPERTDEMTSLMISDGKFSYALTTSGQQKQAFKNKIDPQNDVSPFDAAALFKIQHKASTLKLLPDETIDGHSCYVIETTPKSTEENPTYAKMVTHYDKKTGLSLKSVCFDKAGKIVMSSETTDFKVDADIPADQFVFKAPAGVEVIDASASQQQQQTAEADQKTEAKTDQPKAAEEEKPAKKEEAAKKEEKPEKKEKPVEKGLKGLFKKLK
jgi:outer membrane lipoprotein-sorting protein